jgi:hypothetical protein
MTQDTIVVFTGKGLSMILEAQGSSAWVLDPQRVSKCTYLVCTQNRHSGRHRPEAPHRAAFLVGKISGVEPVPGRDGRWLVRISEYAPLDKPEVWDGGRNPVRYTTLHDLGIDPATLESRPIPQHPETAGKPAATQDMASVGDVLADAKQRLAAYFGVSLNSIEITIRA